MELIGPMIVMNWRMNPICHRLGLCSRAGSTLSPGRRSARCRKGKLLSRICVGNMGSEFQEQRGRGHAEHIAEVWSWCP